jgi:hypothetical protein
LKGAEVRASPNNAVPAARAEPLHIYRHFGVDMWTHLVVLYTP